VLLTLLGLPAVPAVASCSPSTPDSGSWRLHARRAVADVLSNVQTARLALEQSREDHVLDAYLQTVAIDAEEAAGKAAQTLESEQPPRAERERYDAVTGKLDEATGLLGDVRIAVVEGRSELFRGLVEDLQATAGQLDTLEKGLGHPARPKVGR